MCVPIEKVLEFCADVAENNDEAELFYVIKDFMDDLGYSVNGYDLKDMSNNIREKRRILDDIYALGRN